MPGIKPGIYLTLRRGSGQTDASLSGGYRGCSLGFITGVSKPEAGTGSYTFGGDGTWSATFRTNVDGEVFGPHTYNLGTYTVAAAGGTNLLFDSGFTERGQLLAGGDVLCVSGGIVTGHSLLSHYFVREGSGMGTASLSGTYAVVGLFYDFGPGVLDWVGVGGTLTADGAGRYTATLRKNEETFISDPYTETGTYTVSATGHLVVTKGDGQVYEGGLSPDRTFGVYGGGTSTGSMPGVFFLVR